MADIALLTERLLIVRRCLSAFQAIATVTLREEKYWGTRAEDPEERRKKIISLTPKGKQFVHKLIGGK
ncbi:hypothetical protein [Ralstonia phage P-PSG-11-1]|uniref:Uncharacterized protein n=1 Tax=Ralstonia phage P-PSG-11 TaxID=2652430 RepID=A0A5P8D405_9CAUD|nr:hypothetical protein [Ralstonia phage P-PSG-11]QFP93752.1 hypothetical protein [Ralstonia phage P-PSG-11-1]